MDLAERKARILYGQHLTNLADQKLVCRDLNGIQAQFLSAALHALDIRTAGPVESDELVKSWTIRGTVHLFDPADLPLFLHEGRTHYLRDMDQMTADEHITLERKRYFADLILDELARGPRRREDLKAACFAAGMTEDESQSVFNGWGGTLRYLAETGRVTHVVGEDKGFQLCPPFTPMAEKDARLELARRYFAHYGPATVRGLLLRQAPEGGQNVDGSAASGPRPGGGTGLLLAGRRTDRLAGGAGLPVPGGL